MEFPMIAGKEEPDYDGISDLLVTIVPEREIAVKVEPNLIQESESSLIIPSIYDSIDPEQMRNFAPFCERYFVDAYCTKFSTHKQNLDTCVKIHTNKLFVVYLSHKHSAIQNGQTVKSLNFQVTKKTNRLNYCLSGKSKRGAQHVQADSILCFMETNDNTVYPIRAGVEGRLLEINEEIIPNPNLIINDCKNLGFIAIILPNLKTREANIASLVTSEEYNN